MGVLENPLQPVNGYMSAPQEPGHGVRFNKDELRKYELTPDKLKGLDLRTRKQDG